MLKTYVGSKIIQAEPMSEIDFLTMFRGIPVDSVKNKKPQAGYRVVYPDGYVSWSPTFQFENAYREVIAGEKAFFATE